MKKIVLIMVLYLSICSSMVLCEESKLQEQVLDIKCLTKQELLERAKENERNDLKTIDMQQEGQDYMYRMQQQMMRNNGMMNQFGGYRY